MGLSATYSWIWVYHYAKYHLNLSSSFRAIHRQKDGSTPYYFNISRDLETLCEISGGGDVIQVVGTNTVLVLILFLLT